MILLLPGNSTGRRKPLRAAELEVQAFAVQGIARAPGTVANELVIELG